MHPRQEVQKKTTTGKAQRWRVAGLCVGLAAITFAVFGQTLHHEFVDFDDNEYVYDNAVVAGGRSWHVTGA